MAVHPLEGNRMLKEKPIQSYMKLSIDEVVVVLPLAHLISISTNQFPQPLKVLLSLKPAAEYEGANRNQYGQSSRRFLGYSQANSSLTEKRVCRQSSGHVDSFTTAELAFATSIPASVLFPSWHLYLLITPSSESRARQM